MAIRWQTLFIVLALWMLAGCASVEMSPAGEATPPPGEPAVNEPEPTFILPTMAAPTLAPTPQPAIQEARYLQIEWPSRLPQGDSGVILVRLDVDEDGFLTPTVVQQGNVTTGRGVKIPNLYDTHNVFVEARLDMVGADFSPAGLISERMQPGKPVAFAWNIRISEIGKYLGTIDMDLRFIPIEGGAEIREGLANEIVEIQVVNFLGLGGTPARLLGVVGMLAGSVLSLDNLAGWVWSWFKGRRRAKPSPE